MWEITLFTYPIYWHLLMTMFQAFSLRLDKFVSAFFVWVKEISNLKNLLFLKKWLAQQYAWQRKRIVILYNN